MVANCLNGDLPILKTLVLRECFVDIGSFNVFNSESFKTFVGMHNGYGILDVLFVC